MVKNKRVSHFGIMKGALIIVLLFALSSVAVFGDITLNRPLASDTIAGTAFLFRATNSSACGTPCGNVTFNWLNGSTLVTLCYDDTQTASVWECTASTAVACPDGTGACSSRTFNARLLNTTNALLNDTNNTGITVDNTNPTIAFSLPREQLEMFTPISYQCVGSDNSDTNLNFSAILGDPDGTAQETITQLPSGTFDQLTGNSIGTWRVNCTVGDNAGNNVTRSGNVTLTGRDVPLPVKIAVVTEPKRFGMQLPSAGVSVAAAIIIIAIVAIIAGGKGGIMNKRRR